MHVFGVANTVVNIVQHAIGIDGIGTISLGQLPQTSIPQCVVFQSFEHDVDTNRFGVERFYFLHHINDFVPSLQFGHVYNRNHTTGINFSTFIQYMIIHV